MGWSGLIPPTGRSRAEWVPWVFFYFQCAARIFFFGPQIDLQRWVPQAPPGLDLSTPFRGLWCGMVCFLLFQTEGFLSPEEARALLSSGPLAPFNPTCVCELRNRLGIDPLGGLNPQSSILRPMFGKSLGLARHRPRGSGVVHGGDAGLLSRFDRDGGHQRRCDDCRCAPRRALASIGQKQQKWRV